MPSRDARAPFTKQREEISKKVAGDVLKRSEQVVDSFDGRPYGADNATPEEARFAWSKLRENPDYLNSQHATAQRKRSLPPDALDRKTFIEWSTNEAQYMLDSGQMTQAQYDRAVAAVAKLKR